MHEKIIDKKILNLAFDIKNYGLKNKSKHFASAKNKICGDEIKVELEIKNKKIKNIKIAYGGMSLIPKRAINCEKILINSNLSEESFERAKKKLEKDFNPINDTRATKNYRMEVAKNLLMKKDLMIVHQNM